MSEKNYDSFTRLVVDALKQAQHGKSVECDTWAPFLPAFAHGRKLPSKDTLKALTFHLSFCTHCSAEVARERAAAQPPTIKDRLRAALARFNAQLASASGASATETLDAAVRDASGNPTDKRVQLELLATPYVSKSGFHLVVKAPGEWQGAALTVFIPEDAERYLFESGFTATVDEDGYVVMSGEDLGEEFDEDVQKIPPQMLEIYLQRKE